MDQRSLGRSYYYVILVEFVVLISVAALMSAVIWMTKEQREAIYSLWKGSIRITLVISLLILVENACFYLYQKCGHTCGLSAQNGFINTALVVVRNVVFVLFIADQVLFPIFAAKKGLIQGSDIYMAYLRPVFIVTFMPIIDIEMVFAVAQK